MESRMSEPSVEDLISFASSQTDNLSISLQGNSCEVPETSNLGHDFNIDMNKTFDLNKHTEHSTVSSKVGATLEPFNKRTFDCMKQKQNAARRLSEVESLESDESLGLLPDVLMNDEMTYDFFHTELSSNEFHDGFESEINQNPASFVFSPPSDNQFNRISLFLKNISTPLPNFGNPRRLSSTPKILAVAENYSSPNFLPDEKEEPIAGSCYFKFETGINLDDLNSEKPLTSTYKTVPPLQLSHILNELNEETDLKSEVNLKNKSEGVQNNLNITQTFSHTVEDLLSYNHEDSFQNVKALNNTFKINQSVLKESADVLASLKHFIPNTTKSEGLNNCNEKEKVKTLDSTFAIPGDKVICNMDCEKTFVIDFNPAITSEVSSNSMVKDGILSETCIDYVESFSKKQEQIANVTFIKDVENDTQTNLENHCYNFHGAGFKPKQILEETFFPGDFKPMKPISEETFSENNFNETKVYSKNVSWFNCESQSVSSEILKMKVNAVSEKIEIIPMAKVTQEDSYLTKCEKPISPKAFSSNSSEKEGEKTDWHDQINLTENENDCFLKKSQLVSLPLGSDATFSKESIDEDIVEFHKSDATEHTDSMIELAYDKSLKRLSNTTFNKIKVENFPEDQIDLSKSKNDSVNKVLPSDPLQLLSNTMFSERTTEKSDQEIGVFHEKSSFQNENAGDLASFFFPKVSKSITFSEKSEASNSLESSVFQDPKELIEQGASSFSISIKDGIVDSASNETELCNHSISKEDSFEILSKSSNMCASTVLEKNNILQSDMNFVSTKNCQVQVSQNSEEMSIGTFSEKMDEVKIEPIFIENGEFQVDSNSLKEITESPFKLAEKNKIQPPELENGHCDEDTLDVSPRETKSCFRGTFLRKAADKLNPLKSCSLESKSGLIKPTKIVQLRKVSDSHNGQLPVVKSLVKPAIHKRSIISNLNCSLRLNNSTDKSSKDLNRKFSLSCSSTSEVNKSECKNDFKKPFGIPLKSSIKKPESKFQKLRLDTRSSNVHLKDNRVIDKQNLLTQPDLISDKNPKIVKSVGTASVNTKGSISSRLSLHEKFSSNSLKTKQNGFKSNVALAFTPDKSITTISCPKVIDASKKENLPETNNLRNKFSRHSIATNLPRKFLPLSNSSKTFNSKPIAAKQISAPASNSTKPLLKVPDNMKQPNSIAKNRFSLLPKVQSQINSSGESEGKGVANTRLVSENIKSNSVVRKPCVAEAAQFVGTSISTVHVKQKDNAREKTQSSSMVPTSREQAEKPSSSLIARRIPGKLQLPRKIPAPNYKK